MSTGYNTYIVGICMGLAAAAHSMGWMSDEAYTGIQGLLTGGGLFFLRAGLKSGK